MIKNVDKFWLSWSVAPKNQSITRCDCRAAVCLLHDVKECLWIQEATGEVWISPEHNIIDTAVNEWKNVSMFAIAQLANILINFIAGNWKTKQLNKVSAKVSKM